MQTIKRHISFLHLSALFVVSCNGAPDPVTQDTELGTRPLTETFELCASDWFLPTESGEVLGLTGVDWIDRAADPLRIHFSSDGSLETTWEDGEDVHFDGQWSREGQALHVLRWYELEGSPGVHSVKRELSFFATSETALFHSSCGALTFYRGFGDSSDDRQLPRAAGMAKCHGTPWCGPEASLDRQAPLNSLSLPKATRATPRTIWARCSATMS